MSSIFPNFENATGHFAYRSGRMRRFGSPDKEMRGISRADKLWVECDAGMSAANDLAARNPDGIFGPRSADRPVMQSILVQVYLLLK
jgi:hypothetical protein